MLHPNAPVSLFAMSVYPDNEMSQQPTYAFFASRFIPKCVCDFWFSFWHMVAVPEKWETGKGAAFPFAVWLKSCFAYFPLF